MQKSGPGSSGRLSLANAYACVIGWLRRLVDDAATVDIASLVAFRVLFGALLFVAVYRHWSKGAIYDTCVVPKYFFPYEGLEWLRPLPGQGMYFVYAAIAALSLAFALGFFYRVSAALLFLLFTYAHLCDKSNYLNHYYLVSLLLFLSTLLPLHASVSVDARRRPEIRRSTAPAWMLHLLRFQIGLVYFFGGVAKLKADWLFRALPLRIWLAAAGDFPVLGPLLRWRETAYVMSWAGAVFDISAALLLSSRRTRPLAYACVCIFHVMTARLFQIGMFPWIMIGSTLLFFPPSWPRTIAARLGLARAHLPATESDEALRGPRLRGALLYAVGAYVAVQLFLPLRHWLYAGNVLWTEKGYRFSWNVMLVEKTGSAELTLRDPATGATRQARLRDELTPFQVKMMATQPDMLVSYARHLADKAEARGEPRPEVRADVEVVLNGRSPAPFVDPRVDLARVDDGFFTRRTWLRPAPP